MKEAQFNGVDKVKARSRFVTAMPELIEKRMRRKNEEGLAEACADTLHPRAIRGLELFNRSDYFAAHEELEEAWKEDLSPGRDLYQGVLQVAVAYFQVWKSNYKGAVKMFQRSRRWLTPLPDTCRGVNVAQLRRDASAIHDELLSLGPEKIDEFDFDKLKPVHWIQIE